MKLKFSITKAAIMIIAFYTQASSAMYTFSTKNMDESITIKACCNNGQTKAGHILYYIDKNKLASIAKLEVERKYQEKGLGSQLLLMAFADMKSKGVNEIEWAPSTRSIQFYQRFGAQTYRYGNYMKISFYRDGEPATNLAEYYAGKMFTRAEKDIESYL